MGRSVSRPTNAAAVAFRQVDFNDDYDASEQWDDFIEWVIIQEAQNAWPSFEKCDEWLGREDHAILENGHAYIGVSEYCGLVAVWLVPKDSDYHPELSEAWCEQISDKFLELFGELRHIGTASNGEAFFERA